jgi:hypothetical protein
MTEKASRTPRFFVTAVMPRLSGQTAERYVAQSMRIEHPGESSKMAFYHGTQDPILAIRASFS